MFYRTIRFMEAGIKPCYVFDGKPPTLKGGELAKRKAAKEEAKKALESAQESGNLEDIERFSKRTVKMDSTHISDCKRLLTLMGMPVVEAPCEAEAQCAALAKAGKVYAAASEDMDTLTFGTPKFVRRLWASDEKKLPVLEFSLEKVLQGFGVTMDQFIDICILCGCDYADTIKGVASTTAFKYIQQYGSLAGVLENIDKAKHPLPENVDYDEVKKLFTHPDVTDPELIDLKWTDPDEEGLRKFLVEEKGFNPDRVTNGIAKLKKLKSSGSQMRMDSFFKIVPSTSTTSPVSGSKRPATNDKTSASKKGKK